MELFKLLGRIAVDNSEANRAIDETVTHAENTESRLGSTLKKIGGAVAAAFAVDKIKDFGQACVDVTAAVSAEQSAFEQIMGGYSDTAKEKMGEVADATGMVDSRLTTYMTSMTAKFKGLGYDVSDSTDLAQRGLTLAADSAAFWDKSLDESMSHLNSFINGSYEGGEAIGLFANDTQMAAYAVEKGLVAETKEWSKLDEAIKQATRLEYAENMQKASGAVGQAAKESGQYANVQANLTEKWRQFKAQIGEPILQKVVLPGMEKLSSFITKTLSPGFEKLTGWVSKNKDMFIALKDRLFDVAEFLSDTFSPVLSGLKDIFKAVRDAVKPFIDRLLDFIETGEDTSGVLELLKDALQFVADILTVTCEKIAEFIEWVSGGSQEAEAFRDIILILAASFATYKGVMLALTIAQKAQTAATWAMEAAHKALNSVSPFGWVMLAVTALGALTVAIIDMNSSYDDAKEKHSVLTAEQQKNREEVNKLTESYKNLGTSKEDALRHSDVEADKYQRLWEKLQGIVDQNGKVMEGYENKANFITNELEGLTGTEIKLVDGVIQEYDKLSESIEKSITMRRGEVILSSLETDYANAVTDKEKSKKAMEDAQQMEIELLKELDNAKYALDNFLEIDYDSWRELNGYTLDSIVAWNAYNAELENLQGAYDGVVSKTSGAISAARDAEQAYYGSLATIEQYETAQEAMMNNNAEAMETALTKMQTDWRTHQNATQSMLEEQVKTYEEKYAEAEEALRNGTGNMTRAEVIELGKLVGASRIELEKFVDMKGEMGINGMNAFLDSATAEKEAVVRNTQETCDAMLEKIRSNESAFADLGARLANKLGGSFGGAFDGIINSISGIANRIPSNRSSMGKLPGYATGGIVTRETIARIGEDGPEAVVPLKNNTEWIDNVANRVANAVGRSDGTNVTYIFENVTIKSDSDIEEMAYKMEAMRQKAQLSQGGA